jgi:hypothetical protein
VEEGARSVSPDTIAVGVFSIVGTLLGGTLGLVGERLVRRIGKVQCEIDNYWIQQGAARPDGGGTAEERRLQVTLLNRKELPVTVTDMRVVFYKENKPLEDWTRPHISFVDGSVQGSPVDLVNIPAYTGVTRTMSLIPGRDDKLRELEKADRAEFEADIVGAKDITVELEKTWTEP